MRFGAARRNATIPSCWYGRSRLSAKPVRPGNTSMPMSADLYIAEIPYDSGETRYRYARVLSEDRSRWVRHGLFVEYQRNGTVISEGNYVHGREQGEWKYFHSNGTLAASGHYEQGAEHGLWRYWNDAGVEEPSVNFVHGSEGGA
jgi:hypothetical protein